jgi:hypothetical protein
VQMRAPAREVGVLVLALLRGAPSSAFVNSPSPDTFRPHVSPAGSGCVMTGETTRGKCDVLSPHPIGFLEGAPRGHRSRQTNLSEMPRDPPNFIEIS